MLWLLLLLLMLRTPTLAAIRAWQGMQTMVHATEHVSLARWPGTNRPAGREPWHHL